MHMRRLYELPLGATFRHGGVHWRLDIREGLIGFSVGCRPTSDPRCGSYVLFHQDTEVQVFEW